MGTAATKPRILVVDDSGAVRIRVCTILRSAGYEVAEAADGIAAAQAVLSEPFDAVITDQTMPAMSGLQLCRLLHADPSTALVPVVLLTATSGREVGFWAGRCGAAGFVAKNALADLIPTIERVLSKRPDVKTLAARSSVSLSREAVHARVADLLDRELGDAILAGEVRQVGQRLSGSGAFGDLATMTDALAELVTQIVSARFFWLATRDEAYVFHGAGEGAAAREHLARCVASAFGEDARVTVTNHAVESADPRFTEGPRREVECQPIVFADQTIGLIGLGAERASGKSRLPLVARELAGPLQIGLLLIRATRQAITDGLTGLANRRAAAMALDRELAFARRHHVPLGIVMIDIDHFKKVNDRFGHGAGDRALVAAARAISGAARASDLAARWGGEEFVVLARSSDAAGVRTVAERVRAAVEAAIVCDDDGGRIPITVSCGTTTFVETDTSTSFVARADRALYAAKEAGRNRVESEEPLRRPAAGDLPGPSRSPRSPETSTYPPPAPG